MKLLALFEDVEGPSARLRFFVFEPWFLRVGLKVTAATIPASWGRRQALFRSARDYDVVYVQRRLLPPWDVAGLRRHARRLVYDFDDALWLRDHEPFRSISRALKLRSWCRCADLIIAGSSVLADWARTLNPRVWIMPTLVPPTPPLEGAKRSGLIWIGQDVTFAFLQPLRPSISAILSSRAIDLTLLGVREDHPWRAVPSVRWCPWSVAAEERALANATLGLAPLPDTAFTRGKCGARLLRYLSAGVPALASPVGAQQEIARTEPCVSLEPDAGNWTQAIVRALDRAPLETAGRGELQRRTAARFGAAAWAEPWLKRVLDSESAVQIVAEGGGAR